MLGFEPARPLEMLPAGEHVATHLARLVVAVLLLGSVIAGLLC